jgi:amidase
MTPATHDEALSAIRHKAREEGMQKLMDDTDTHGGLDLVLASSDSLLVSYAAWTGWPIGVVPLSRRGSNGQPYGMFALARAGREDVLLRFMKGWEGAFERCKGPVIP